MFGAFSGVEAASLFFFSLHNPLLYPRNPSATVPPLILYSPEGRFVREEFLSFQRLFLSD